MGEPSHGEGEETGDYVRSTGSINIRLVDYYNKRARDYDKFLITRVIGQSEARILSRMLPSRPMRALDFGCGTGRSLLVLLRAGHNAAGYDVSPNMLAIAKTKIAQEGSHVEWFHSRDEFREKRWPLITCIGVLDYFSDLTSVIRDLRELLEPDGTLIVSCPNAQSPLGRLFGLLSRFTYRVYPRSEHTLRLVLADLGFVVNEVRYAFPALRGLGHTLFVQAQFVVKS